MDLTNIPLAPVATNITLSVTLEPVSKIAGIKALREAFHTDLERPVNENGTLNLLTTKNLFEALQANGYTIVRAVARPQ
jgi:hypothetical protein